MSKKYLKKAVELASGQVALAAKVRALMPESKVSQAHVWNWLNSEKSPMPPAEYVRAICMAVDGQVTPHELRPDLYPNKTDALPSAALQSAAAE